MIDAKGVSLIYPDGTIGLNKFDLKIEPGELVYITGPSGSGKTSLLKLLLGIEFPTEGTLKILDQQLTVNNKSKIRKLRTMIGPVFQEFRLMKGRTALENVMLGMRFLDFPAGQLKKNASSALIKVGLENKMQARVENLSLGERQRVAIARAVARKPLLILADEPTGNLDIDNALNIMELLTSFNDEKTTVIITTHATHLIDNKRSAKLIKVDKGRISEERLAEFK